MLSIDIIAPHMERVNFKTQVHEGISARCAFSGRILDGGCLVKDVISSKWTDWEWLRFGGDWVCEEFALTLAETIPSANTPGAFGGLRNYSFTCNKDALRLLKRDEVLPALLAPPEPPFVFIISEGGKKHASFKAEVAYSQEVFQVSTDKGAFMFDRERALPILNAMQVMYSVIKTDDAQQRTWFTKDEILTLAPPPAKVAAFGIDRYAACHNALAPHRLSLLYRFLVFALNKTS